MHQNNTFLNPINPTRVLKGVTQYIKTLLQNLNSHSLVITIPAPLTLIHFVFKV